MLVVEFVVSCLFNLLLLVVVMVLFLVLIVFSLGVVLVVWCGLWFDRVVFIVFVVVVLVLEFLVVMLVVLVFVVKLCWLFVLLYVNDIELFGYMLKVFVMLVLSLCCVIVV